MKRTIFALAVLSVCTAFSVAAPAIVPFNDPAKCIEIPIRFGLKPTIGSKPVWKDLGLGWSSQTTVETYKGGLSKVGDVSNEVSCYFSSKVEAEIQFVRIKANCFNAAGEGATLKKFRELVRGMLTELGIKDDTKILANLEEGKSEEIDAPTYTASFTREPFRFGYGMTFTLTSK